MARVLKTAREIIGTHVWIDHQEKVRHKSKNNERDWKDCNSKNCCGATKKCFIIGASTLTSGLIGAGIGAAITGIPTGGAGFPIGASIGFVLGIVIGEIIEECEKNNK